MTVSWGDLETNVVDHRWFDLSAEERLALPQGREMAGIDEILEGLFRQRDKLLEEPPEIVATDPTGLSRQNRRGG